MAEATTGTAAPAAPAPVASPTTGAPAPEFQVPTGKRLVDESEWTARSHESEKLKGYNRLASELGVKNFDDLRRWKPALEAINKRKLEPEFVARAFGDEPTADDKPEDKGERQQIDVKKLESDFLSKAEQRVEYKWALKEHEQAVSKHGDLINDALKSLHEKDLSPHETKLWTAALKSSLSEAREKNVYPKGHPLAEYDFRPLDKQTVDAVVAEWKKDMDSAKAESLSSKADKYRSAERTRPSTAAGPGTGQGKPQSEPSRGLSTREALSARIKEAAAKAGVE